MLAPSFDHGVGDPVPAAIAVTPAHRAVLSEGNYLLLDEAPWSELQQLFDEVSGIIRGVGVICLVCACVGGGGAQTSSCGLLLSRNLTLPSAQK